MWLSGMRLRACVPMADPRRVLVHAVILAPAVRGSGICDSGFLFDASLPRTVVEFDLGEGTKHYPVTDKISPGSCTARARVATLRLVHRCQSDAVWRREHAQAWPSSSRA